MRKIHSTHKEGKPPRAKKEEPLEEGPATSSRSGRRQWKKMGDEELAGYAREYARRNGISSRRELQKKDRGLYAVLRERGIVEKVLTSKLRDWTKISDEELIEHAKAFIKENKITSRSGLASADSGLYVTLNQRSLMDRLLPYKLSDWAGMSEEELIAHAKAFINENKITSRTGLQEAHLRLYKALNRRAALKKVLPSKFRDWAGMSNEELLEHAKSFTQENKISSRKELETANSGLYIALLKRRIMDLVLKSKYRDWAGMSDQEFIAHAKAFIKERKIASRKEFEKADVSLYTTLNRRKLMDAVFSDLDAESRSKAVDIILDTLSELSQ